MSVWKCSSGMVGECDGDERGDVGLACSVQDAGVAVGLPPRRADGDVRSGLVAIPEGSGGDGIWKVIQLLLSVEILPMPAGSRPASSWPLRGPGASEASRACSRSTLLG